MGRTRSRCRVVLGRDDQDDSPAVMAASARYRSVYVRREAWRAESLGETLLVFTRRDALVTWTEPTHFDPTSPDVHEFPEMILRASGPLGAHDEAIFVRPPGSVPGRVAAPWESILVTAAERVAVPIEVRDAERRVLVVTYCSRRKSEAAGEVAAIDRYASPRLSAAMNSAKERGAEFRILSGRFGLLRAEDPIPWYDHLLQPEEVSAMVERVTPGIGVFDEVVFMRAAADYIDPYLAVVSGAATKTDSILSVENV